MAGSTHETGPKLIRCKAAVCRVAGEALVLEEVVVAPPKAFEVRIKIICSSLCHTDIFYWHSNEFAPAILGHETVGIVESVGDGAEEVAVGDIVMPMFQPNCRECGPCRSEKSNLCAMVQPRIAGMPRDGSSRITDCNGVSLTNLFGISSFSEYTVVDVASIVKVWGPHGEWQMWKRTLLSSSLGSQRSDWRWLKEQGYAGQPKSLVWI